MQFPLPQERLSARRFSGPRTLAMTIVELLAVCATIGVLTAMIVPASTRILRNADQVRCASNWRQYGRALLLYTSDHNGRLPVSKYTGNLSQETRITLGPYLFPEATKKDLFKRTAVLLCPDKRWDFGFNSFLSEMPLARYSRPQQTIYGIDLCNGGRWLDSTVLSSKVRDLKQAVPKPHAGKVGVLWLDGHTSTERVSALMRADVTRDSPGFLPDDETTPIASARFDR
jgi:prepilin-type processing-associated H-X9-DG protein